MKGDGRLPRVYAVLDPPDQARLVIEALARDDEREADRIASTVPCSTWRAPVGSYDAVFSTAKRATTAALVTAATSAKSLAVADVILQIARHQAERLGDTVAFEVYKAARRGEIGDDEVEGLLEEAHKAAADASHGFLEMIEKSRDETLAELAAFWRAFDEYCQEELGLDGQTVEQAFLPELMHRPALIEGVETDPEQVRLVRDAIGAGG